MNISSLLNADDGPSPSHSRGPGPRPSSTSQSPPSTTASPFVYQHRKLDHKHASISPPVSPLTSNPASAYPPPSQPQPQPTRSPMTPFEALLAVTTQERRRLSDGHVASSLDRPSHSPTAAVQATPFTLQAQAQSQPRPPRKQSPYGSPMEIVTIDETPVARVSRSPPVPDPQVSVPAPEPVAATRSSASPVSSYSSPRQIEYVDATPSNPPVPVPVPASTQGPSETRPTKRRRSSRSQSGSESDDFSNPLGVAGSVRSVRSARSPSNNSISNRSLEDLLIGSASPSPPPPPPLPPPPPAQEPKSISASSSKTSKANPRKRKSPEPEQDAHEWFLEHFADDDAGRSHSSTGEAPLPSPPPAAAAADTDVELEIEAEIEAAVLPTPSPPPHHVSPPPASTSTSTSTSKPVPPTKPAPKPKKKPAKPRPPPIAKVPSSSSSSAVGTLNAGVPDVDEELLSMLADDFDVRSVRIRKPSMKVMEMAPPPPSSATLKSNKKNAKGGSAKEPAVKTKKEREREKDEDVLMEELLSPLEKEVPLKGKATTKKSIASSRTKKVQAQTRESSTSKASPVPSHQHQLTKKDPVSLLKDSSSHSRSKSLSLPPLLSSRDGTPSQSHAPSEQPDREAEDAGEDEDEEDDKLYCLCNTQYDEEKPMVACDRCDEWYHLPCVGMRDRDVDLIDTFICPKCVEANPSLNQRTTYKSKCAAAGCDKPARGMLSKYCCDEHGIRTVGVKIDKWAGGGGVREVKRMQLWESVGGAKRVDGVVVEETGPWPDFEVEDVAWRKKREGGGGATHLHPRLEARLQAQLESVERSRAKARRALDAANWREKLIDLVAERAARLGECGWDQRLCFGDAEWAEFGDGVLDGYDDGENENGRSGGGRTPEMQTVIGEDGEEVQMQVDGEGDVGVGWWCNGKQKCDRHGGWQKLRLAEVEFEKNALEDSLARLTHREREIRKKLEPPAQVTLPALHAHLQPKSAAHSNHMTTMPNGHGHGDVPSVVKVKGKGAAKEEKKKKKKAAASNAA